MEVRAFGREMSNDGDTDILIAYHQDKTTSHQSILMISDYDADVGANGYPAAKLAIRYIESASSQTLNFAYAELVANASEDGIGTLTAGTNGTVTAAVETVDSLADDDLKKLGVSTGFDVAGLKAFQIML